MDELWNVLNQTSRFLWNLYAATLTGGIEAVVFEVNTFPPFLLFINTLTQSGRKRPEKNTTKHNKHMFRWSICRKEDLLIDVVLLTGQYHRQRKSHLAGWLVSRSREISRHFASGNSLVRDVSPNSSFQCSLSRAITSRVF